MVQMLELQAFTAKGLGLIPDQGTKSSQVMQYSQKERKKKNSCFKVENGLQISKD